MRTFRKMRLLVLIYLSLLGGLICQGAALQIGEFYASRIKDGWSTNIQEYAARASYRASRGFDVSFYGSTTIRGSINANSDLSSDTLSVAVASSAEVGVVVEGKSTAIRSSGHLELSGPGAISITGLGNTSQPAVYALNIKITGGLALTIVESPGRYSTPGTSIYAYNNLEIYASFVSISGYGPCLWARGSDGIKVVGSMLSLMEHPSKSTTDYSVAAINGPLTMQGSAVALHSPVIGFRSSKKMLVAYSCIAVESDSTCFSTLSESIWFDNVIVTAAAGQGNVACIGNNKRGSSPSGYYLVRLGDGLYDFGTSGDYPCVSGGRQIFVEGADLRCCAPNSSAMSSYEFYMNKGTLTATSKLDLGNSYRTMMTEAAVSALLLKSGAIEAWGGVHIAFFAAMATQFLNAIETESSGQANAVVVADDFVQTGGEIVQGVAKVGTCVSHMYVCGGFTVGCARTPAFVGGVFNGSFATTGKENISTQAKSYDFDNPYYLSPTNAAGQQLVRVDYEPYWVVEETLPPDVPLQSEAKLTLASGWNWGSLNVTPTNDAIGAVFAGVTFADEDVIKSAEESATYYGGKWYGELTTIKPGIAYMVRMSAADSQTLTVAGSAAATSVEVVSGWNWIGPTATAEVSLDALTHSGGFTDEDVIKSEAASATYYGGKWYGELKSLQPGLGYKAKFAKDGTMAFSK